MKKKWWQVVLTILYYGFTFSLGILIALVLPGINYEILTYESFNEYVENEEFTYALDLLGGIYNEENLLKQEYENGSKLYMFETISIYNELDADGKISKSTFNESYSCFLTNVAQDQFVGENNKAIVLINENIQIKILHDSDGDEKDDSVATLAASNYIFFTIDKTLVNEVNHVKVLSATGDVFIEVENDLNYQSNFFNVSQTFINKYNEYSVDNFSESESNDLEEEFNKIKENNSKYSLSGSYVIDSIKKEANNEATIFVLVYFIWIYILGDFLVGKRYIMQFVTFVYRKIKSKINKKKPEVELSQNFYSTVTFKANVCEEYDSDIILTYEHESNKDFNFKVILTKTKGFVIKSRVHSGLYILKDVSCKEYKVENLSDNLEVKGFFVDVSFEIKK